MSEDEQPSSQREHPHTSVTTRPAGENDNEFLAALYATTRAAEMAVAPWTDEAKAEFLDFQRRAQVQSYSSRCPDAVHEIVLVDHVSAGRIWVDEGKDEIRLLDIAVLPEYQNLGVGSYLVVLLQSRAHAAGKALRHSVLVGNEDALRLYHRLGFTIIGDIGSQSHYLMEWTHGRPAHRL